MKALRFFWYCIVAVVTLEMAPRVEDYFRHAAPFWGTYGINSVFQSSEFGKEGKPGARYLKWSMNSLGYRGPEPVGGRVNIITFGASETFGLYESPGREYPRQLEERLNLVRPGEYNVVNIAIPGLRIGRVAYLENAIRRVDARFVVVYPSPANYIGVTKPFCGTEVRPVSVQPTMAEHSRLIGRLEQLAKKVVPVPVMTEVRRFLIEREIRGKEVMERVPEESLAAFRADIECSIASIQRLGAQPILVTHATLFGDDLLPEDHAEMIAWRRFYPSLAEAGFIDLERRANIELLGVAQRLGVPVVRGDQIVSRGRENFADFVHFTDRGAGELAEALANLFLAARR